MKSTELTIGQKYIWRRNSSTQHEVTYLGCDDTGKYKMYEFEYIKEGGKMQTFLSEHHVESDIKLMEKVYYIMYNVGTVKYLLNYSDGSKTHKDGSIFFDIATFKNKKLLEKYVIDLQKKGYRCKNNSGIY